jgi:uncharacterized protein
MNATASLAPVEARARIESLDVLRGFALLGILLMNIEGMAGPLMSSMTGVDPALSGADRVVDTLVYLFVQGKFYPLFSLLFGMGFAAMLLRAREAGTASPGTYLRRVLALMAIGLAHGLLVWSGDILLTYALLALPLLLFFRDTPEPRLATWGIVLMLFPCALMLGGGAIGSAMLASPQSAPEFQEAMARQAAQMAEWNEAQRLAYGSGTYLEAVAQRATDVGMMLGFLLMFGTFILGLFLLGAWLLRSGAMAEPTRHAQLHARLRWLALPLGLAMTLLSWWLEPTMDFGRMDLRSTTAQSLQMVGGALMALGYLAWVVHALQGAAAAGLLRWLAPAGRMALTNYLLQSLVMTWIFSGYGLGFFEQLPRAWQPALALAFFVLQVLASRWWMARFRFGPVEWLWRWTTYGKPPPMQVG